MKHRLIKSNIASPVTFLTASAATFITAPNLYVAAGGLGLSIAAGLYTYAAATGKNIGRAATAFALAANAALALNGSLMIADGIAVNNTPLVVAGALLGAANGALYGVANACAWLGRINSYGHGSLSQCAGLMIAGSGLALNDPVLAIIGIGFMAEATMRLPRLSPT